MTGQSRPPRAIPLILTRRGLALLGLAAVVCAVWAAVRLRDLLALAALAAAAVVVALVWLLLTRLLVRVRAGMSSDVLTPSVGETVTATASLRPRLPFSQSAALVWEGPGGSRILPILLPRRGEAVQAAQWTAERRGPLPLAAAALVIADPLGVARIRIPLDARTEVLVLPTLLPVERLPSELTGRGGARGAASGAAAISGAGRGASGAEEAGGGLREYRAGDPPRRVHWKQSARQDRLLVNVPEHGAGERLVIALIVEAGAYPDAADFEHAVSLAATLVMLRAGPGGARGDGAGRAGVALCTVSDEGGTPSVEGSASSAGEAIRALARAEPAGDSASPRDGGPRPDDGAPPAFRPTVIVTGTVTPAVAALAARAPSGIVVSVSPAASTSPAAPTSPVAPVAAGSDAGYSAAHAGGSGTGGSAMRGALPAGWDLVRAPALPAVPEAAAKAASVSPPSAAPPPAPSPAPSGAKRRAAATPVRRDA